MSFDVELLVSFRSQDYGGVSALAQRLLPAVEEEARKRNCPEAVAFLRAMAERSGPAHRGPKNGLAAWTYGGNYTQPDDFVEALIPFWDELLRHPVQGGPFRDGHVLVFFQREEPRGISAREIYLELPGDYYKRLGDLQTWPLVRRAHNDLPFRW